MKKRRHFEKPGGRGLFVTCNTCREKDVERVQRRRANATAQGLHFCTVGSHRVEVEACTSEGRLYASCNDCRARKRAEYAATVQAAADAQNIDDGEGALGDDAADGVQVVPPGDEYDAFFGDGSDMDIDLPDDAAINSKEAKAIKTVNEKLAELCVGHCSGCREEGFDVKLKTPDLCTRCSADTSDTKLWSDENNTNPSALIYSLLVRFVLIAR